MTENTKINSYKLEIASFIVFFSAVALLMFFVFRPFFNVLVLATVLAVLCQPIYTRVKKLVREKNIASGIVVLAVLLFVIIPILFLSLQIFQDAQNFFTLSHESQMHYITTLQSAVEKPIQHFFPSFSLALPDSIASHTTDYTAVISDFIKNNLAGFLSQTSAVFFQVFCLLFAFFFFMRDGEKMLESVVALSPFKPEHTKEMVDAIYKTINSVIRGTLFVTVIRWVIVAIFFYAFGISDAILWASLAAIVGAIPGLGTFFSFAPAVIYLFLAGHILPAVGLAAAGIVTIFGLDNLLTTYFFGKGLDASPLFILFSILGGIIFFGPLGFIFGPLVLSLFIAVVEMYKILLLKS